MKILIYQPRMFGDIIVGSSCAEALKDKYPNSYITFISSCKALTETNPFIDQSFEIKIPRRFETLFYRVIKIFYSKSTFLLHWLPEDNMLQSFMVQTGLEKKNYKTRLYLTNEDIHLAKQYLEKNDKNKKFIAIQDDFGRKWNQNEFLKLKKQLSSDFNLIEIGQKMNIGGKYLNMRQAAAVTSLCDLFVGGISGNLHASVAVGTTTIGISNVFNPEWDMPEFSQNEFIQNPQKKHRTVQLKKEKFCGNYAKSFLTKNYVYIEGGEYSPQACFKKFNKESEVNFPKEDFFDVYEHPCRCSIDCDDVLEEIERFFTFEE